jgi:hypothetical protein
LFTDHVTASLDAVNDCNPPAGIVRAEGETVIGCAATTCTVVVPPFEPAVAVSVTLPGEEGAVKSPLELTVPPEAVHDELVAVLSRYAVNCTDCPIGTLGEPGKIVSAPFTGVV